MESWRIFLSEGKLNYWSSSVFDEKTQEIIDLNKDKVSCPLGSLACQDISYEWAKIFKNANVNVEIHHGMYKEDGHTWLEVNGIIFDPTAAQFDEFPEIDEFEYVIHEIEE